MTTYSPTLDALVDLDKLPELGPGRSDREALARLQGLSNDDLFAPHAIRDRAFAELCRSAVLLHRDCLDASHEISQSDDGPTASYLHGVMHRREPDFGNAKYWFRRVRSHAIEGDLFAEARRIAALPEFASCEEVQTFAAGSAWDAMAFVDLCERGYSRGGSVADYCRRVAREEWRLLFERCYRRAIGES